jgi:hypothetical protein
MGILDDPTSFLSSEDFEEPSIRYLTSLICPCCREEIEADEDVALLQVGQVSLDRGKFEFYPSVGEDKDFKYKPIFLHLKKCWSDLYEDLQKIGGDQTVYDTYSRVKCETCESGIRDWEVMVLAQYGEFHTSPRHPNNDSNTIYTFKPLEDADSQSELCLSCILNLVGDELGQWEDLSENKECGYCTHARCWRIAQCGCECHR